MGSPRMRSRGPRPSDSTAATLRASIRARSPGDSAGRLFHGKCYSEVRRSTAVPPAAIKGKVRALPQRFQQVSRKIRHGRHPRLHDFLWF
ncbi:MAG: hypothetical protein JWP08_2411 [Bryobacterales bacterium]|nr:hypothetical protein [Bryobacterales bacterium]